MWFISRTGNDWLIITASCNHHPLRPFRLLPRQQQCSASDSSMYSSGRNSTEWPLADLRRGRGVHKAVDGEEPAGSYSLGKREHEGKRASSTSRNVPSYLKWFLSSFPHDCVDADEGAIDPDIRAPPCGRWSFSSPEEAAAGPDGFCRGLDQYFLLHLPFKRCSHPPFGLRSHLTP